MDVFVVALRQLEAPVDVRPRVLVEHLEPGQSADYIGTQVHGFLHQFSCSWVAENPLLGKGDHFDMSHIPPLFTQRQQALESA